MPKFAQAFVAKSPQFCLDLPSTHRFPMAKYRLLPSHLLCHNILKSEQFFEPSMASIDDILTTHTAQYWQSLESLSLDNKQIRKIGLPLSQALIDRERLVVGATIDCAKIALHTGIALSLSGGTHHAFAGSGEGFCVLNDVCVASHVLLQNKLVKRILIVDLDVHQGNGNASIMADNTSVFVFSMHGKKNYPYQRVPSDLDIDLPTGTSDDDYLALLQANLEPIITSFEPDFIFYQAGADVLAADRLGKLDLSLQGAFLRDLLVFEVAKAYNKPVCVVMGGGYSPDIHTIVTAHANTFVAAKHTFGF